MQRLTVEACVAIRIHSETGNVRKHLGMTSEQSNHVFGDHHEWDPAFCNQPINQLNERSISHVGGRPGYKLPTEL